MEILLLIWSCLGLLSLHFMWAIRDQKVKGKYEDLPYVRSLMLGLLLGPIGLIISFYIYTRRKK